MEELGGGLLYLFLNFIGDTLRWLYGSVWRTIARRPKFTYSEYLYGSKKSDDRYDTLAHGFNNAMLGFLFCGFVLSILIKFS